jgi:hypothetical protein
MRPEESPSSRPFYSASASEPGEDRPPGDADDQSRDDRLDIPSPAPIDTNSLGGAYERKIFGDELGGQKAKRPPRLKGEW